jgi:FAD binding domain
MRVQTLEGGNTDIRDTDLQQLRTAFRGQLIEPCHAEFDEARRVWNGTIDRRPALIAQCSGAADVIAAVNFASHHGLLVAVRGGGHSVPGHSVCDDGLLIDLSRMRGVVVDPRRRTVRAQGRRVVGRRRPRIASLRARDLGRHGVDDGNCRSHARRWKSVVADSEVRQCR